MRSAAKKSKLLCIWYSKPYYWDFGKIMYEILLCVSYIHTEQMRNHSKTIRITLSPISLMGLIYTEWKRLLLSSVLQLNVNIKLDVFVSTSRGDFSMFYKQIHTRIIPTVFVKWRRWFSRWGEKWPREVKFVQKQIRPGEWAPTMIIWV